MALIPLSEPSMVLNEEICKNNIAFMAAKAKACRLTFRPHFKTHQSPEIGEWFRACGVDKITVSSLKMAAAFADCGWQDITVAFPVNCAEYGRINLLADKIHLNLLVANAEGAELLSACLKFPVGIYIKIDTGYHRCGIDPQDECEINRILNVVAGNINMKFEGFLTHAGHVYSAHSREEVLAVHRESLRLMGKMKEKYIGKYPGLKISVGDTPSCSLADDFGVADEIRPGNFVFYDAMQFFIGSCGLSHIALAVKCPVVGINRERKQAVIYGGGVHFSKDRMLNEKGETVFGVVVENREDFWGGVVPDTELISVSQEHGVIRCSDSFLSGLHVGDFVAILPVHSCMTADLLKTYYMAEGKVARHL